ncbi:MAG: flagellar motor protein MotA [Proteobacteria bacterium]|nr:flagellar motor protein MotA [Pseudomonadota bacterium]
MMAIALGGSFAAFIDTPSILIVIGGTFAITTVCFTVPEIIQAQKVMLRALLFQLASAQDEAKRLLDIAQKARANGLLSIQNDIGNLKDAFLRRSFTLAVDGTNPEMIDAYMRSITYSMVDRHNRGAAVLKKSAEIAPAMGLIGTLVGLVQMLGNLNEPDKIGPAMAVALLTTLYGAILANMVFMPLAAKLERNSQAEQRLHRLYHTAVMSVVRQENPRQLEVMLNAVLPPAERVKVFD